MNESPVKTGSPLPILIQTIFMTWLNGRYQAAIPAPASCFLTLLPAMSTNHLQKSGMSFTATPFMPMAFTISSGAITVKEKSPYTAVCQGQF